MKRKNGFTLIELIISIAILGLISVTFLSIFNMGLINISRAGNRTTAVEMAEKNIYNTTEIDDFAVTVILPDVSNNPSGISIEVKGKIYDSKEEIGYTDDFVDVIRYIPIKWGLYYEKKCKGHHSNRSCFNSSYF